VALAAILVASAALRLWRLDRNGYDNESYAAAVRSMAASLHNFLYNAFDPAGFVSVDKPPLALWIQVASVKIFGFHALSILLPQVLEGVASVWLIHHLVRRSVGAPAGLLAGLLMALTPVSVAVDRSGNTESCLVLVMLLAAWALLRATETGARRHLLLAMGLIGVGFNVKMLAAFVVLPVFALVYAVAAPVVGTLAAVAGLLALGRSMEREARRLSVGMLSVGLAGLLVLPAAWALSSVLVKGVAVLPSADVARLDPAFVAPDGRSRARSETIGPLVEFLKAHRKGERYPILTPSSLASLVATNQVRYVVLGDLSAVSRRLGGEAALRPVADWVRSTGSPVDPALWGAEGPRTGRAGELQLYDLKPAGTARAG
jgi:hypothetical protein